MALFSSAWTKRRRKPGERVDAGRDAPLSIIASGMRVQGELSTAGEVQIEGTVIGTVHAEHVVRVAPGGVVEGEIRAPTAILGGKVSGPVRADERVEVLASAIIQGDITTPRLAVHEGAIVCGQVRVGKPDTVVRPPARQPTAGPTEASTAAAGPFVPSAESGLNRNLLSPSEACPVVLVVSSRPD